MKKVVVFTILILFALNINAQDTLNKCYNAHYLAVDFGVGSNSLTYDLNSFGNRTPGIGFMSRIGYRWFFVKHFGLGTGLTYNNLRTFSKLNYEFAGDFDTISYHDFKERQRTQVWKIPIGLFFQSELGRRWTIGAGVGVEFQLLAGQSYYTPSGTFDVKTENYTDVGQYSAGKTHLKNVVADFAEINFMYALSRRVDLDFGFYGSYAFKNMKNSENKLFNVDEKQYVGVLNSNIIDNVKSLSFGFMAGLRVRLTGGKSKSKPEIIPEPDNNNIIAQNNNVDTIATVKEPDNQQIAENTDTISVQQPIEDKNDNQVVDNNVQPVDTTSNQNINPPAPKEEKLPTQITFGLNQADNASIVDNGKSLDDIADILKSDKSSKLRIVGHTCDLGTHQVNLRVGERRALYVKNQLISRGVESKRLITETAAETQPLVPNTSEANRKKNRRVELWLIK